MRRDFCHVNLVINRIHYDSKNDEKQETQFSLNQSQMQTIRLRQNYNMSNNQERDVEKYKTQVRSIRLEKSNERQADDRQEEFEETEVENDEINIKVRENDDSEFE